jgi:hypothetical protein
MTTYTITLESGTFTPSSDNDAGVTWAREKYNAAPTKKVDPDDPESENRLAADNSEYLSMVLEDWEAGQESVDADAVQDVVTRASASYAEQMAEAA